MKTIQEIVNGKVASMIEDGTIVKAIGDGVEKAITSAIKTQFESYGSITKQIEEAIKGGLKVDTSCLPFDSYNAQMLVIIKQRLGDMFKGQAAGHFLKQIDEILETPPAEVTIEKFLETITSYWKTDEPWDCDDLDECMTVEVKEWEYDHGKKTHFSVNLWKQLESTGYRSEKRRPDVRLFIADGEIRINHSHKFNPTSFDQAEAYIFKLYAAGTKITGVADFNPDDHEFILKATEY